MKRRLRGKEREIKMENIRILVVEDNKTCAEDLRRHMENLGYKVWNSVSSFGEAVKQASALRPDAVFLDVGLPVNKDVIECGRKIRNELNIPVVFLVCDTRSINRTGKTDPFAYILKPVDEQKLFLTMENIFIRSKLEKQISEIQKGETILSLIDTIAHDFSDILSIIRGYTELSINTLPENTKARQNMEKVIHAADRGKDLIENYFMPTPT